MLKHKKYFIIVKIKVFLLTKKIKKIIKVQTTWIISFNNNLLQKNNWKHVTAIDRLILTQIQNKYLINHSNKLKFKIITILTINKNNHLI